MCKIKLDLRRLRFPDVIKDRTLSNGRERISFQNSPYSRASRRFRVQFCTKHSIITKFISNLYIFSPNFLLAPCALTTLSVLRVHEEYRSLLLNREVTDRVINRLEFRETSRFSALYRDIPKELSARRHLFRFIT